MLMKCMLCSNLNIWLKDKLQTIIIILPSEVFGYHITHKYKNPSLEDTAKREIYEETGIKTGKFK